MQQFQYINGCKQMNNLKRKPYHNGVRSKTERHQCTSAISLCKKGAPQGSPGHSSHGSQIHHLLHQKNRKSYMVEDVKHHTIKRRFAPNSNTNPPGRTDLVLMFNLVCLSSLPPAPLTISVYLYSSTTLSCSICLEIEKQAILNSRDLHSGVHQ